jgi:Putative Ig domain/Divergent InlB B-repeat domain
MHSRVRTCLAGTIGLLLFLACGEGNEPNGPPTGGLSVTDSGSGSGGSSTLTVQKSGTGTGTVTSNPSGINCGSSCSRSFSNGTTVTLTATPAAGSIFAGWSGGGCTGTGTCTTTITSNRTVIATFNTGSPPPPPPGTATLTVTLVQNGTASGRVTSTPAGIDCGTTCSAVFPVGTPINLFASVLTGAFTSWSTGPCAGSTNPSCSFTLNANTSVTAVFGNQPLTFLESTLPDGNIGADYAVSINTTGGSGTQQHRFSIVAGSLPDGLQMQQFFGVQSTIITGRPTRLQTSTFTVRVDDGAETATRTFSITIRPAVTLAITLPGPIARDGIRGQFYFQNLFASGGQTPYNWSITGGALPPGLQIIRASNGNRIQGTPTATGTFSFNLTVRDQGGQQATQLTSITIN